jgi:hypothetical protein
MVNERTVQAETARQLADSIGISYFETSARTGEGVEEAIEFLVRECLKRVSCEAGAAGVVGLEAPQREGGGCTGSFRDFFSDLRTRFK